MTAASASPGGWASSALLGAYRIGSTLGTPALRLLLQRRRQLGKEDAQRFGERLGRAGLARPEGPVVWLHAVSVGEALSILGLIDRIRARWPDLHLLVTTGTVTSARALAGRLPPGVIHQYVPADLPGGVARFLDHWRPRVALFAESELWPNLIVGAARRGTQLVLVNGRVTPQSFARRRWIRPLFQGLLGRFALVLAQTQDDAVHLRGLGAPDVRVTGNLKLSAPPLPAEAAALATLRTAIAGRPLWVAASTNPGEEDIVADAHARLAAAHPGLLTLIAPRHPHRGPEIAAMLAAKGCAVARRGAGEAPGARTGIYVADTLGELGLWYRLAGIVFVGGSLVPHGGQNLLEPARLGCAVLAGPHTWNFAAIVEGMQAAGAVQIVTDAQTLAAAVQQLLADPARRDAAAAAARRYVEGAGDVLELVVAALAPCLDAASVRDRT